MTDPTQTPETIQTNLADWRAFVAQAQVRCMLALLAGDHERAETWGWLASSGQDRVRDLAAQLAAAGAMDEARAAIRRAGL